jgi:hypothetical protein
MKKRIEQFKILMILILTGAFLNAQEAGTNEVYAYIREITGAVEIKEPGEADWRAALIGEQITNDTMISTGFKSSALIVLGNSTLLVRPLTRLRLEEIQNVTGEESVNLFMHAGRVRANVSPPSGGSTDFTVRGPNATASVRGTSFDFDGINLSVDQGRVHISGGDGSGSYVGAGQRSVSNPETGRTAGPGEQMRATLTPPLPPAAAGPGPRVIVPGSAAATPRELSLGLEF